MPHKQKVYKILDDLNISYKIYEHPPLRTVAESQEYDRHIEGGHTKNLFLKNKDASQYYLVIVEAHKRVALNQLRRQLNEAKLSFGSPEKMLDLLGIMPGSVSAFGIINDVNKAVKVYIDKDLWEEKTINFHPNINTATVGISHDDFVKFLDWTKHQYSVIKIPTVLTSS